MARPISSRAADSSHATLVGRVAIFVICDLIAFSHASHTMPFQNSNFPEKSKSASTSTIQVYKDIMQNMPCNEMSYYNGYLPIPSLPFPSRHRVPVTHVRASDSCSPLSTSLRSLTPYQANPGATLALKKFPRSVVEYIRYIQLATIIVLRVENFISIFIFQVHWCYHELIIKRIFRS